jgi:polysaccharide biosynthesis protein PslG
MRDARRYRLIASAPPTLTLTLALTTAACSSPPTPLPPPDLSAVTERFAPATSTLGQALGIANQLSFDATARSAQLDRLGALGVHVVRRDFLWQDLEPSRGAFDFAAEDAAVDDSGARGFTTIGILAYDTTWAAPDGDTASPPPPADYAAFVEATARHFAGRVDVWEIWNEPNVGYRFWKPREDGAEYARLLAAAYPAVKRGNPNATVVLGGLFYHYEGIVTDAVTFLEDAFTADPELGRWFDVLGLHPYPHYPPQAAPESADGREQPVGLMLARIRALLTYYGTPQPIYVTEYGWPVYGTVDEATQARFTIRGAVEAMAAGAERVCIYTLDDGPNPTNFPPEDAFGVYRNNRTPKPAATALHLLATLDPELALAADESAGGVRRYLLASPSQHVEVVFAVDGATHDLGAPAGATVLGLDGAAVTATTVGADPVFVLTR